MNGKRGSVAIALGLLLIVLALCLSGYNLYEQYQAERAAASAMEQLDLAEPMAEMVPDYILDPTMEMPTQTIDGWEYIGLLEIPVLSLSLPVISVWSDDALNVAPCRYSGSAYTGDMILAAHNYSAYFAGLDTLVVGDAVIFTDIDGNVFSYTVAAQELLSGTAVEQMQSGEWDLTLFTCNYSGRSRVTVRCVQEDTIPSV